MFVARCVLLLFVDVCCFSLLVVRCELLSFAVCCLSIVFLPLAIAACCMSCVDCCVVVNCGRARRCLLSLLSYYYCACR